MGKICLTGATVLTGIGARIQDGVVVVDDGKITKVGKGVRPPKGATIIDLTGMIITPGLIDVHVHIGTHCQSFPNEMQDTNEMTDPVTPALRTLDAVYPDDTAFNDAMSGGVTCTQSLPGSTNVIGGQGVIIKTKPDVMERMVVRETSGLKAALGENPVRVYGGRQKLPMTRMGSAFLMREAFIRARNYRNKMKEAETSQKAQEHDLGLEALLDTLDKKMPFRVHCHRSDDIQTAVRVAEEFGLDFTIEHCTEGHLIAEWLAGKKIRAAVGPTLTSKSKIEVRNKTWETPLRLWQAGVHFCIITDHPVIPIEHLILCASLASRAGLPSDEALKAVTIYAAEHLGIEDRVGSIEPGKDADIAVWDGDPLDSRSKVVRTFIDGKQVFSNSDI